MNRHIIAGLLGTALLAPLGVHAAEEQALSEEARGIVKTFAGSLKNELQGAMKAGGPERAVEVCNLEAPQIAQAVGEKNDWQVGRTAFKVRNPSNRPDDWEREVLARFENRKAEGEDVTQLEHAEVVESDGERTFRYMKAIPTGELCLNCHGSELDPGVAAKIDRLYPEDEARGFALGDIRGAFTLQKPL